MGMRFNAEQIGTCEKCSAPVYKHDPDSDKMICPKCTVEKNINRKRAGQVIAGVAAAAAVLLKIGMKILSRGRA